MRSAALAAVFLLPLHASVIGVSRPAQPLTRERILAEVPKAEQKRWLDYLARSAAQMARDKAALAAEREGMMALPSLPKQGFSGRAMPLHLDAAFYATPDAHRMGEIVLSFQLPSGGWSKNLAMDQPRAKGQFYAAANLPPKPPAADDFDKPHDEHWHYMGTLDNDATNTEIHFLAELSAAFPGRDGDAFRAGALRGIRYLLHAQYPNGGWPQVWPLEGGYHDAITFNDDAVTESAETLTLAAKGAKAAIQKRDDVFSGEVERNSNGPVEDFSFVPADVRTEARAAVKRAIDCILKTQIVAKDGPTAKPVLAIWAQQNDPLTLKPSTARNYEPEALAASESASIMDYLMSLDHPSEVVVRSVNAAAAWFQAHRIMGYTYGGGRGTPGGRKLTAKDGAGPLWARYYSLDTGKPIFGDRDKTIHDDLMEISDERRNGYGWYGNGPAKPLENYAAWQRTVGAGQKTAYSPAKRSSRAI